MEIMNRAARMSMCQSLRAGVSTDMASSALLVAARDGDPKLGDVLMAHSASIASNNGQAIIETYRGGSADVLSVLLKADASTSKQPLEAGFQAATEVHDLNKRVVIRAASEKGHQRRVGRCPAGVGHTIRRRWA